MPAGESEAKVKTKALFDEVLKRYTDPPSEKKKSRKKDTRPEENIVLETLKKNLDLSKSAEDDETVFNNTYRPEEGSPRYTKNRQRERELAEKANNGHPTAEGSKRSKIRKKSTRALPEPPLLEHAPRRIGQDEAEDAGNAPELKPKAEPKATPEEEGLGKKAGRHKKGRKKGVEDARGQAAELEPEDELLQEYQQRIAEREENAVRETSHRRTAERTSDTEQRTVLNNEVGKKKRKKLRSREAEGEAGPESFIEKQGVQAEESKPSAKSKAFPDTEREGLSKPSAETEGAVEREETAKHQGKKKKKQKKEVRAESDEEPDGPVKPAFDDSLVLGVYIHRTDRLKTDLMVSHPMVKVHVIDENTGQYVKKEDSHRPVSSFYEQETVDHVLPIMTQPFDFRKHKSTIPEWEEQIIFNERFGYFLQDDSKSPRVMLFFEVLDFISMDEARANVEVDYHERGFRKIAWAFLKLVGTNGVLNVDSRLRLQLYCPPPHVRKVPHTVEVVEWWRRFPRNRYASTLYVTVKGLKPPEHVDPSMRSMMALQQERGSTSYSELQSELVRKSDGQPADSKAPVLKWSRVPGQVCRIPNKSMLTFRGGQMGCFTLRFSPDGRALAAACADRDAFPIIVYEIPSGKVLSAFNGHLSIVYDLCWSRDNSNLLSASSDGTVRMWNVERLDRIARKVLPHPSFVYCAQYHPSAQNLVVTGGYDCLVRVWDVEVRDVNGQLLQEFEGHKSFINCLCFDADGLRMFSGDNVGLLIAWNTSVDGDSPQSPTRRWGIEREIEEADLKGIPVSTLEVHPNGRRLLIQAKDSVVRVMDLRILAVQKYTGATNYRERIHSTFSPCGSFIFSGSEDGMAYVWNAETGDQVAVYSELCYPTPLRDVAFHPHENMVAFCAFGQNQPVHVYLYDHKVTQMELESMKGMNRIGSTDTRTFQTTSNLAAFRDPTAAAMDRFASTARMSLKMQHVKQKLDSVLNPPRNFSAVDYRYDQAGGGSGIGRDLSQVANFMAPGTSVLISNIGTSLSLPVPSLLSPHSKLHLSGSLAPPLVPQATLNSQSRFSPVGQRFTRAPSLRVQTSFPDQASSAIRVEAESYVPVQQTVVSLYDYSANRSDELTVRRGDVIHVLYKDNDNWWFGRMANGQQGYFPANYVADERGLEEELSHAIEGESMQSEEPTQSADRSTPTKVSAAVSISGDLKFISEQDTDAELPVPTVQKKKKKVKKPDTNTLTTLVTSAMSDPSVSSISSVRKKKAKTRDRPLPQRGEANSAFEPDG
ncbi:jouberin isoform X2 [Anguilla anguilla]|uniref:jouberin isoform X2 n=1 Tax=Anguilla anguilla TaxID=7936 RepID=UPI0015AB28F3|nr:jouberin isoform X2 [Anguilla anguilla]